MELPALSLVPDEGRRIAHRGPGRTTATQPRGPLSNVRAAIASLDDTTDQRANASCRCRS